MHNQDDIQHIIIDQSVSDHLAHLLERHMSLISDALTPIASDVADLKTGLASLGDKFDAAVIRVQNAATETAADVDSLKAVGADIAAIKVQAQDLATKFDALDAAIPTPSPTPAPDQPTS